jgi:hypothetical protein
MFESTTAPGAGGQEKIKPMTFFDGESSLGMKKPKENPGVYLEAKDKKEQPIKPFVKKVEARADFIDSGCGREIKKGEEAWLVLTQKDIDNELEINPNAKSSDMTPKLMCADCMDKKLVEDSGRY